MLSWAYVAIIFVYLLLHLLFVPFSIRIKWQVSRIENYKHIDTYYFEDNSYFVRKNSNIISIIWFILFLLIYKLHLSMIVLHKEDI